MLEKIGKLPGEPWECQRCYSEGSRAVLTRDREPGCHVCRDVTSAMGLLSLVIRKHIASLYDVETPFVSKFPGRIL